MRNNNINHNNANNFYEQRFQQAEQDRFQARLQEQMRNMQEQNEQRAQEQREQRAQEQRAVIEQSNNSLKNGLTIVSVAGATGYTGYKLGQRSGYYEGRYDESKDKPDAYEQKSLGEEKSTCDLI
ncbi:MAG: hypothetical protein U1E31_00315 [Rickettsiales bacterium]